MRRSTAAHAGLRRLKLAYASRMGTCSQSLMSKWTPIAMVSAAVALNAACTLIRFDPDSGRPLPPPTADHRSLADRLRGHVEVLAGEIGPRNLGEPANLRRAERYLAAELSRAGRPVAWRTFGTPEGDASNLEIELPGSTRGSEVIVVGAHYDTVRKPGVWSPGANDNASGCAAVLELARLLAPGERTVRLVLFANEEPPYFWTDHMGSLVYARAAKQRGENIVAMLSIETIGSWSDEKGSQKYPPLVGGAFPAEGNFIAFVGPSASSGLIERCTGLFRGASEVPAEGAALPTLVPRINSSDHWSFWKQGWPALMVTDTAPYRYPQYHTPQDTPEKLNYERMARVVEGLAAVVEGLAGRGGDGPESSNNHGAEGR